MQTLAEGLHAELRPYGIDVLALAPGPGHSGFAAEAGMTMTRALQPREVAASLFDSLGRHARSAPGGLSKLLTWSLAPLPRRARIAAMGRVMTGMTARNAAEVASGPGPTG